MKALLTILLTVASLSAFGYEPGIYSCKNGNPKLPNNTYEIKNIELGGATLPYIEAKRYFWDKDTNSPLEVTIQGLAAVSRRAGSELLTINQFRIEFDNGEFVNCKQD